MSLIAQTNSIIAKKLKFPAIFPAILLNDVIYHVTEVVGAKCWIETLERTRGFKC